MKGVPTNKHDKKNIGKTETESAVVAEICRVSFLKAENKLKIRACFSLFRTLKVTFTKNVFKGKFFASNTPAQVCISLRKYIFILLHFYTLFQVLRNLVAFSGGEKGCFTF